MAARRRKPTSRPHNGPSNKAAKRPRRRRPLVQEHHPQRLAWYGGLALMALLEVIDWPIAIVIAVGHELTYRARTEALRELAEGIEAGA